MVDHAYVAHELSDGSTWAGNIAAHGHPTQSAPAENLARADAPLGLGPRLHLGR